MIIPARQLSIRSHIKTKVCVVGSGPAGITIGLQLAALNIPCVILESGAAHYDPQLQKLNEAITTCLPYNPVASRLRMLGGSSNCWSGWCRPFDGIDFAHRDWVSDSGWPISLDDIQHWYQLAETLCEISNAGFLPQTWLEALPQEVAKPGVVESHNVRTGIWQYSRPTRFGERYRSELQKSRSLQVITEATATTAHMDGERVKAIEAVSLSGTRLRVDADAFVLAGGGIENARLLLTLNASGGSMTSSAVVGRYFTDHLVLHGHAEVFSPQDRLNLYSREWRTNPSPPKTNHGGTPHPDFRVRGYFALREDIQRKHRIPNWAARLDDPIGQSNIADNRLSGSIRALHAAQGKLESARWRQSKPVFYPLIMIAEQIPNRNSLIGLASEKDVLGIPLAQVHWRLAEEDRDTYGSSTRILASDLALSHIGRTTFKSLPSITAMAGGEGAWIGNHHIGTTRMGTSPRNGVVDRNCRVFGTGNLYVAGSSVFCTSGSATPTLTIVALAARLADHLSSRYRA